MKLTLEQLKTPDLSEEISEMFVGYSDASHDGNEWRQNQYKMRLLGISKALQYITGEEIETVKQFMVEQIRKEIRHNVYMLYGYRPLTNRD